MYSSFHASAAIGVLLLPLPLIVKIPLAIGSHVVVDMLGEGGIDSWVKKEAILCTLLLVAGFFTGHFLLAGAGIFLGNLFDILDMRKTNGHWGKEVIIHKPNRFGKFFYPPVLINLTTKQTLFLNKLSVIVIAVAMFLV